MWVWGEPIRQIPADTAPRVPTKARPFLRTLSRRNRKPDVLQESHSWRRLLDGLPSLPREGGLVGVTSWGVCSAAAPQSIGFRPSLLLYRLARLEGAGW